MGLDDTSNSLQRWRLVEEKAAAAIDLPVDEARSQDAAAKVALLPAARALRMGRQRDNDALLNDKRAIVEELFAVEETRPEQHEHQRVSVTLRRCGGLSGSRPRRRAQASARR